MRQSCETCPEKHCGSTRMRRQEYCQARDWIEIDIRTIVEEHCQAKRTSYEFRSPVGVFQ